MNRSYRKLGPQTLPYPYWNTSCTHFIPISPSLHPNLTLFLPLSHPHTLPNAPLSVTLSLPYHHFTLTLLWSYPHPHLALKPTLTLSSPYPHLTFTLSSPYPHFTLTSPKLFVWKLFQYGILIPIICSLLYIFVLSMLFRTSFSDPGVIPRKCYHFHPPTQIFNCS